MAASASSSVTFLAKRLQGKVALITGGASGIGETTARLFADHGAKVVIADVQTELGRSVSEDIKEKSGQPVSYVQCNVTKESDVENAVNKAVSLYGKLDIMFNNAGISGKNNLSILEVEREEYNKVMDINLYGGILGAKHAARVMIPQNKGCILFTSSVAGIINGGVPYPYSMSKVAVTALTKTLAVELGQHGIRVNCISPSATPTPLATEGLGVDSKTVQEIAMAMAKLKGVKADASDIAAAALYLASDESRYVSGLNVVVDGATTLKSSGL